MRRMRKGLAIALSVAMVISTGTPAITSNAAASDTGVGAAAVNVQESATYAVGTASDESDVDLSLIDSSGSLAIDENAFPDVQFKTYVSQFDTNSDGKLSKSEREAVTSIEIHNSDMLSLKGVGYFTNVTSLNVNNCTKLSYMNVNQLTNLSSLSCEFTKLTSFSLDKNLKLTTLDCSDNSLLTGIIVNKNSELITLDCSNDENLTTLLLDNPKLISLNCCGTAISELDLSASVDLMVLDCSATHLTELNLNTNEKLSALAAKRMIALPALDLSNHTALTIVNLDAYDKDTGKSFGAITDLNVSGCTGLEILTCSGNALQKINLQGATELQELYADHTKLKGIDLSSAAKLTVLDMNKSMLEALDVSNNEALTNLILNENYLGGDGTGTEIKTIDLSNNRNLITLECTDNGLRKLDVSMLSNLQELDVSRNSLTKLDVSKNTALKKLLCNMNNLTGLDVSNCTEITTVGCVGNKYEIELDKDSKYTFDLTNLPEFESANSPDKEAKYVIDTCQNGTINNYKLTPVLYTNYVTYSYDIGDGKTKCEFRLNIKNPFNPVVWFEGEKCNMSSIQSIPVGTKVKCTVKQGDELLKDITFSSENEKAISVNSLDNENIETEIEALSSGDVKLFVFYGERELGYVTVRGVQKVTSITMETAVTLEAGTYSDKKSYTLNPVVGPEDAANKAVIFESSDSKVATVDNYGKITAVGKGTATITCTPVDKGEASATCTVNVTKAHVNNISIKNSISGFKVAVGGTVQLESVINPDTADNKSVTWSSSDPSIATVDANGLVTPIKPGETTIVCMSEEYVGESTPNLKTQCKVVVVPGVTALSVDAGVANDLICGTSMTVTPSAMVGDEIYTGNYKWSCDDPTIVSFSSQVTNGAVNIIGRNTGTAKITCTANDGSGKFTEFTVTVRKAVTGIFVTEDGNNIFQKKLSKRSSFKPVMSITPADAFNKEVSWTVDNDGIVSIAADGTITAVKEGTVRITYKAVGSVNAQTVLTVVVTSPVKSIGGIPSTLYLNMRGTSPVAQTLVPVPQTEDGSKYIDGYTWSSDNEKVATVAPNGNVLTVAPGTANITCMPKDGSDVKAVCKVIVNSLPNSIAINAPNNKNDLLLGKGMKLTATLNPSNVTLKNVTWTSLNQDVLVVDQLGNVTAKALPANASSAVVGIVATSKNDTNIKATYNIIVKRPVSQILISGNKTILLGRGASVLTAKVLPDNACVKTVVWTSSNKKVATVANGVVTGVAKGTAVITCKSTDGSGVYATYTVTVKQPVTSIKISSKKNYVFVGKTLALKASVAPKTANSRKVKWSTSNKKIATVSSKGVVKGRKAGTVTITCKAADGSGIVATYAVTVKNPVKAITVKNGKKKINGKTIKIKKGNALALSLVVGPSTATDKTVTWKSSKAKIATVNPAGVITAVRPGTVTITVKANDGSGKKATFKVKVTK